MGESPGKMYALASVLTILAILAVMLRFYSRRIKKICLSWDDYFIMLALVSTIATGICIFVGAALGGLGRHTQTTPDGMPILDDHTEVTFRITYVAQLTQTITFGFTKLAVILFYRRIFTTKTFSVVSWVMIGLTVMWTIAFFAANLLQCLPISVNWSFGFTPGACIKAQMMYIAQAWSDVFTDVLILSMPLPWLWKLQMPPTRKLCVVLMFQLGALVVGAGVAKLVIFYKLADSSAAGDEDLTYLLTPTVYWPMVESSLGIVGACLPLLRPILTDTRARSIFSSLRTMLSRSSSLSNSVNNVEAMKDAKMEARGFQTPRAHNFENVEMV